MAVSRLEWINRIKVIIFIGLRIAVHIIIKYTTEARTANTRCIDETALALVVEERLDTLRGQLTSKNLMETSFDNWPVYDLELTNDSRLFIEVSLD
ncbi:unnamed protein product [Parnassius apollo]|uniref:(apollo) hypothetical protein n=1 Tax=Parnassius apollo TaxID=110799 RepID=A0A8S3Y3L4_PARAO|nr:unnamed protein product [Parnassius apollo]